MNTFDLHDEVLGVPFRYASGQAIRFISLRFMIATILHAYHTLK
jgi:hypothetical protein